MNNKYLYSFVKDTYLRSVCLLPFLGVLLAVVLVHLGKDQVLELKDIQIKQALIDKIPMFLSEIKPKKVLDNNKEMDFTLNGIISDNAQAIAIINNKLVRFDGVIGGKHLITITDHSATLCDINAENKCITLYIEK